MSETNNEFEALKETWSDGLEGQALDIVASDSGRICVQAGPGTGKSYCMTRRILRLIEQQKVAPNEVLAVTFTRTAATDLKKELTSVLGEQFQGFRAQTLHSLCHQMLKSSGFVEAMSRHPRLMLTSSKSSNLGFEAAAMFQDLLKEFPTAGTVTDQSKLIKAFEAAWARRQSDPLQPPSEAQEIGYEAHLLAWLTFHQAMLVGELIPLAWQYMNSDPANPWRTRFKAILVDEYQDLNRVDQEVIDLLADQSLQTIVGDLDQSIYSFRHAHPQGLTEFSARQNIENVSMEISRRCPKTHLKVAQQIIRQNTVHAPSYPSALDSAPEGTIFNRRWRNHDEMIQGVISYVQFVVAQGIPPGKILIMAPARPIGQEVRRRLRELDIPAHSYFTEEALEDENSQRRVTVLALAADHQDRTALRCWLGDWKDHQNAVQYKGLREYCEANSISPWDALENFVSTGETEGLKVDRLLSCFADLKAKLEAIKDLTGEALINAVFPEEVEEDLEIRLQMLNEFDESNGVVELFEKFMSESAHPEMPTDVDHVRIMSLHKSKGLTADAAAIIGCMEGLVPRHFNPAKSELTQAQFFEEQRRLFYVGLTRSRGYLLLAAYSEIDPSFARTYQMPTTRRGRNVLSTASRFLNGLGQLIEPPSTDMTWQ